MGWLDKNWHLLELIGLVAGIVVWAYSTFATASSLTGIKEDISASQNDQKKYVDDRNSELRSDLRDMRAVLDKIDQRTYDMAKERRP